ncbi:hypothetical protein CCUS01_06603 [Colletotrichum cuscutae]|uniref:PH domain-containing protein n=1 Tax=Colletotrichum cuscutae TaxID=1209917 RepID=A0AAI9V7J4_9PEZI|nr:hypothetical protein CCUS01_06603 [Colletotrichum cuscutae]
MQLPGRPARSGTNKARMTQTQNRHGCSRDQFRLHRPGPASEATRMTCLTDTNGARLFTINDHGEVRFCEGRGGGGGGGSNGNELRCVVCRLRGVGLLFGWGGRVVSSSSSPSHFKATCQDISLFALFIYPYAPFPHQPAWVANRSDRDGSMKQKRHAILEVNPVFWLPTGNMRRFNPDFPPELRDHVVGSRSVSEEVTPVYLAAQVGMRRNLTDTTMEVGGVSRPMTSPTDLHEVCQNEPGCCQLSHARAESIRLKKKKKKKKIPMVVPLNGPRLSGQGQKGPPMKKGLYTNETGGRRTSSYGSKDLIGNFGPHLRCQPQNLIPSVPVKQEEDGYLGSRFMGNEGTRSVLSEVFDSSIIITFLGRNPGNTALKSREPVLSTITTGIDARRLRYTPHVKLSRLKTNRNKAMVMGKPAWAHGAISTYHCLLSRLGRYSILDTQDCVTAPTSKRAINLASNMKESQTVSLESFHVQILILTLLQSPSRERNGGKAGRRYPHWAYTIFYARNLFTASTSTDTRTWVARLNDVVTRFTALSRHRALTRLGLLAAPPNQPPTTPASCSNHAASFVPLPPQAGAGVLSTGETTETKETKEIKRGLQGREGAVGVFSFQQ